MDDYKNIKRNLKKHIAFNEFEKRHSMGTIVQLDKSVCACRHWIVGEKRCGCGNTYIYLDYSETTNTVFPVKTITDLGY
jgi:hypothetical protein